MVSGEYASTTPTSTKHAQKDSYPLPTIDQLIDATSGHLMLSFMDAYAGYNQVPMAKEDIPKTAFITHRAVYAYRFMPFGLVNAGATTKANEQDLQGPVRT